MLNQTYINSMKTPMRAKIGKRLHNERVCAKLSLERLAEVLNCSKPTVHSWERGWKDGTGENTIPTLDQLLSLSVLYKCTPEYLLCEYDQKTKQQTDVCFETGLLPESYNILNETFSRLREETMDEPGYFHIMYQFLNHVLANSRPLTDALYYRVILENLTRRFDASQYKELIIEGFNAVEIQQHHVFASMTGMYSSEQAATVYIQPLITYYKYKGISYDVITDILHDFKANFEAIYPNKLKQANFAITEYFMDIVNSFIVSYPQNVDAYKAYTDAMNISHTNKSNTEL